jgi:formylglycine-generating enzyme required for sulfatase activity
VSAYAEVLSTTLKHGAGMSHQVVGDSGWNIDFVMPVDKAALTTDLKSCAGATWSDDVLTNNTLPLNCVSFNVAYAFCIWDEGRLPTEAEWQFAAGGGNQRRVYPWIVPVMGPDITHDYANYAEADDESAAVISVGLKSLGNGRWGHADLAGNVSEWTLDYFHPGYPASCMNCLNTTASELRSARGGAYSNLYDALWVTAHTGLQPVEKRSYSGFRCARDSK